MTETQIAVVGAGIVGLAVARELALRDPARRVVVLEREERVAAHQTGRNSGVAHAGIYYAPGSLKARLCVAGVRELAGYCEARGLAYERCGKLIVALDRGELPALDELARRGAANGVPGLRRLDAAGLREIEPHAAGIAALHSPETAIVDFAAVARALADDLRDGRRRDPHGRRGRGHRAARRRRAGAADRPAPRSWRARRGLRRVLRRRLVGSARACWPAPAPTRGSSRSAARTCGSSPTAASSSAA